MTKEEFIKDIDSWCNHRHLLWPALEATRESKFPVLELGCGNGSTPYLQKYCEDNNRELISWDSNKEWADKFGARHISPDWPTIQWFYKQQFSVVLIDESPGEHRKEAIDLFASHPIHFKILVVHDSEPIGWNASDYQVRPQFDRFEYVKDLQSVEKGGAWATVLSNHIDVTKWP